MESEDSLSFSSIGSFTTSSSEYSSPSSHNPHIFGRFEVFSLEDKKSSEILTETSQNPENLNSPETGSSKSYKAIIPDQIKYEDIHFETIIGSGAFGQVWKGTLYGQEVAIKKLKIVDNDKEYMDKLVHEVNIMRSLRHPNIVEYMGVCIDYPNACIITEYLAKGSLQEILANRERQWPWRRYLRIAQDITRGIIWLHTKAGIIHRDVKPSNILISSNNEVKICDFGLSHVKRTGELPGTYGIAGTPVYMANEVLEHEPYSYKADIFSLGMVLCELITGEYPLAQLGTLLETSLESIPITITSKDYELAIISGIRPLIPADTPNEIRWLIEDCWNHDPELRPGAKTVMARLIEIEKGMNLALTTAIDDKIEDLPAGVRKIVREQQAMLVEMENALHDTKQLEDAFVSIRNSESELLGFRLTREDSENECKRMDEELEELKSKLRGIVAELNTTRYSIGQWKSLRRYTDAESREISPMQAGLHPRPIKTSGRTGRKPFSNSARRLKKNSFLVSNRRPLPKFGKKRAKSTSIS